MTTKKTPLPPVNYPFRKWCQAKGFTPNMGYDLVRRGVLRTVKIGRLRFVTEEEDQRFDALVKAGKLEKNVA